jgi:hypothetical protein
MMLDIGQLLGQKTDVVVVDQSDGSHDVHVRCSDRRGHEPFADQIPKRLRAIFIALASDEEVELLQEFRVNGNADATQMAHEKFLFPKQGTVEFAA